MSKLVLADFCSAKCSTKIEDFMELPKVFEWKISGNIFIAMAALLKDTQRLYAKNQN